MLDTNVRRVLGRVLGGEPLPPPGITRAERARAEEVLPADPEEAATWAVAVMELGALVCTAASPRCDRCPLADACRWRAQGHPVATVPLRRAQPYAGTDRQCRGRLLAVLRDDHDPVHHSRLAAVWHLSEQRERCLRSLVDDGLVVALPGARYALP